MRQAPVAVILGSSFSEQGVLALHARTLHAPRLKARFRNVDVQRTRLASQYAQVGTFAASAGAEDAARLGAEATKLGERLLLAGRCLVMGDLWPASVLVRGSTLGLIDWELATFGQPAQDVAHLLAHIVMLGVVRAQEGRAERASEALLKTYRAAASERFPALWDEQAVRDAGLHFGSELLARAWGPFQAGGPLSGQGASAYAHRQVTELGLSALRAPRDVSGLRTLWD